MVSFARHQRKDDVTQQSLQQFDAQEGVLYVGVAWRRRRPASFAKSAAAVHARA
jgi:hypothetical protein